MLFSLGASLILAGLIWFLVGSRESGLTSFVYDAEDIVYQSPLFAVHEMEPSDPASIPFLPKDGPQPDILVSENFYNFGRVGATAVVSYDFAIKNDGDAPLTISRAYTTCGCTTAELTAAVIPPGKVSILRMTYDAGYHDARGQTVRRGVILENNDPDHPQLEIWAQAAVANQ
jgi:hypothetical protein